MVATVKATTGEKTGGKMESGPAGGGEMWQAVLTRDTKADGQFVYAVRSPGIYCLPTCPSRRPSPRHVAFLTGPNEAVAAGFRPCKRCLPDQESPAEHLVLRVCEYIPNCSERSDRSGSAPTLLELARAVESSPSHLQRVSKAVTGITSRQYASAWWLDRFKAMIKDGQNISAALYQAGFGSSGRLYESSWARLGMSPGIIGREDWA